MPISLDYPSARSGQCWGPPEPTLLDTCVVQHLATVFQMGEFGWSDEAVVQVRRRVGPEFAAEILALGDLLFFFEQSQYDPPVWAVTETSRIELAAVRGPKGDRLRRWWADIANNWARWQQEWPQLAAHAEQVPPAVSPDQLTFDISSLTPLRPLAPPFGPFRDPGDRALIRDAVRCGFPAILTTDIRSFWKFRAALFPLGVEVWRPSDWARALLGDPIDSEAIEAEAA